MDTTRGGTLFIKYRDDGKEFSIMCFMHPMLLLHDEKNYSTLNNKGLALDVKLEKDSVACGDSVMISFVVSNPTDKPVAIDSLQRIILERYSEYETFGDVYDTCICQGIGDTVILPHSQYMKNVKVCIRPEFFFTGLNNLQAHFLCSFLIYDDRNKSAYKKYIYIPKNGIIIYSKPFKVFVGNHGDSNCFL